MLGKRPLMTRYKLFAIRIDWHGDTEKVKVESSLIF